MRSDWTLTRLEMTLFHRSCSASSHRICLGIRHHRPSLCNARISVVLKKSNEGLLAAHPRMVGIGPQICAVAYRRTANGTV
jgi:hypothetical protein